MERLIAGYGHGFVACAIGFTNHDPIVSDQSDGDYAVVSCNGVVPQPTHGEEEGGSAGAANPRSQNPRTRAGNC